VAEELRVDPNATGVVIYDVDDTSAAAAAGFKAGDVILEVNGQKVLRTRDLDIAIRTPQRAWRVVVVRGGRAISAVLPG
jgi:S1-C subfamily serine protease